MYLFVLIIYIYIFLKITQIYSAKLDSRSSKLEFSSRYQKD